MKQGLLSRFVSVITHGSTYMLADLGVHPGGQVGCGVDGPGTTATGEVSACKLFEKTGNLTA